jgi:competence protein ComEC
MFTLFIFDFYLSGHRNSYNFLAFSALAMLAFDPNAVYDIGFQFSFLALMGILLFYKPISRLWPFKKIKIIRYGWNLMAVSIAAQIAVAPLSIYYFHQFPFYFWLSSLWAIPWTYVIVMLGMLLLLSGSQVEFLAEIISSMIHFGVELLMDGINWVHSLPYGHVSGIWIEKNVLIITYASILFLVCYVYFKKQWSFNFLLMGVLSIGIIQLVDYNMQIRQSGITVYDVNAATMIDLFDGNKVFALKGKMITSKQEAYVAQGNRQRRGTKFIKAVAQDSIISENNFYAREGIVILGHKVIYIPGVEMTSFNGKIDYLVITQNCHIAFEKILDKFSPQKVIIDNSLPKYLAKSIIEKVKMHKIDVHDVQLSGAIEITW